MTCINAGIFYGVKLRIPSATIRQLLYQAMIIIYKQQNSLELTAEEAQALKTLDESTKEQGGDDDEEEEIDRSRSKPKPKRRHVEDDEEDQDEEEKNKDEEDDDAGGDYYDGGGETIDYQVLNQAQDFLGFQVQMSKGNTWNGSGFTCLLVFEPLNADNCVSFHPQDLLDMERNVTQKTRDCIDAFLKLIGHKLSPLSWYLYPGAG